MPGPITILRQQDDTQMSSSSAATPHAINGTTNGVLGSSFAGASSGSFREAIAASLGKEAADIMDYSIARLSASNTSTDSDMTALPSTSYPRNKIETSFCSNFKCCGQALENLHDLLQHYEEAHVKFEDDDLPAMIADEDAHSPSSSATASQPPSPKSVNASAAGVTSDASSSSSSSITDARSHSDANESLSVFETTIMRSPYKGKKRSFGQFANNSSNGQMHQSLRRALIDGGVRHSGSRSSSVYSANSPFSTPGSSIPGTPTLDGDGDGTFFGNGSAAPAFSALSLRNSEDHDLPSCAPPNLFFPAPGSTASTTMGSSVPPAKREKTSSIANSSAAVDNGNNSANLGDRPYKCTSPGCDKAYKQMNGLKYHRLHGQCNQNNLHPSQQLNAVVTDKVKSSSAASGSTLSPTSAAAVANALGTTAPVVPPESGRSTPTERSDSPGRSSPDSQKSAAIGSANVDLKSDKVYICQVGACGKRYKNLNGLRYHYLHSGSHGLLGLQLLHSNGGGSSARADASTGRPAISTNDLSSAALAAAAQAAATQQQLKQQQQQQQKHQSSNDKDGIAT